MIDLAYAAIEQNRTLQIVGTPGVGKSWIMKHLAQSIQSEGTVIVLRHGRTVATDEESFLRRGAEKCSVDPFGIEKI